MRSFMISIPHKNYSGDKTNNNEKGKACCTYGEDSKCIQNFGGKTRGKERVCKTQAQMEYNIKRDLKEIGWEGVNWINLFQDRVKGRL